MMIRTVAPSPGSREPTDLRTFPPAHLRTFRPSHLHTFTPPYRVKPKIGAKERERCPPSVSFFDWAKNETQKSPQVLPHSARVAHPSTALRRAAALWRGTNRKGPEGHPVDSPAGWAQTAIRSFRAFASPPGSPDRARPGETTVLVTLDAGTESRNVPAHPFSLSPFLPLTLSPTLSSSHTGPHGRRGKRSALDGVPPTSSSATFVSYANADVQMHLRNPRTQPPNLTPLPPAPFLPFPALCSSSH